MKVLGPSLFLAVIAATAALADNSSCPSTPTAISNATIQASPAGCTQVDMQFSLMAPVVSELADFTQSSSDPSDSNVLIVGTGVAGGTGSASQGLIFSQSGGFYGDDTSASGYNNTGNETWNYEFEFSVTDTAPGEFLTGIYIAANDLTRSGTVSDLQFVVTVINAAYIPAFSASGSVNDAFANPVTSTMVYLDLYVNYTGAPSSFTLGSFELGFDEGPAPEPSTFMLIATALAMIGWARRRALTAARTAR